MAFKTANTIIPTSAKIANHIFAIPAALKIRQANFIPIAKIIFGTEEDEEITMIENVLKSHPLAEKFDFIRSEKTLYEILPGGIGKGTAVTNLCRILNIDNNKTIAIGDYNNDISMFKAAGTGIAVSNACEEALSEADYITVSNEEHAIAQVIYDLENNKYK